LPRPLQFTLFFLLFFSILIKGEGLLYSQKDTLFWFVAPEAAQNHGDRPILFRFASYNQTATVIVEQPANPSFPVQTFNINASGSHTLDVTPWIDMIENKPANTILNYGFRIRSTQPISVYYEINPTCACNPDIFALKGKNALGQQFFLPFQNFLNNASYARSAFDIVATENNTQITITPRQSIVGNAANVPFTITLNAGQTYSATATSPAANLHLGGSVVTSNKPIAVTISDDSVLGTPYGGCADILGDQAVPVPNVGDEYIVVKGYLNGPDKIYTLATQPNTAVFINGSQVAMLGVGQMFEHTLTAAVCYITTTAPAYVLHMSGFGCEVGQALLPAIKCSGSEEVAFVRSTNEFFALNILVQAGGQNNFSLNGNAGLVTGGQFAFVPGTNNQWMYAQINLSNSITAGAANRLVNSTHRFHVGLIHGGASTGCRYGYFSDYAQFTHSISTPSDTICEGQPLNLNANPLNGATYIWSGPNSFSATGQQVQIPQVSLSATGNYVVNGSVAGCPIVPDTVFMLVQAIPPTPIVSYNQPLCLGGTLQLQSNYSGSGSTTWTGPNSFSNLSASPQITNVQNINAGSYQLSISENGCPGPPAALSVFVNPTYLIPLNQFICQGDSFLVGNQWRFNAGSYLDSLQTVFGCDSVKQVNLQIYPVYNQTLSPAICRGQNYFLPDGNSVTQAGNYSVAMQSLHGCDSLFQVALAVNDTFHFFPIHTICAGDSVALPNGTFANQPGALHFPYMSSKGCDSAYTVQIIVNPSYQVSQNVSICQGQTYTLPNGNVVTQSGNYSSLLTSSQQCDSLVLVQLTVSSVFNATQSLSLCQGQAFTLPDGQTASVPGSYPVMLQSSSGCDSLVNFQITQADTFSIPQQASICQGDSLVMPDGTFRNIQGSYSFALTTVEGCDSNVVLHLQVNPTWDINTQAQICQGKTYILPNQTSVSLPGIYPVTLPSSFGCDSLITTTLIVNPEYQFQESIVRCQGDPYTLPNGQSVSNYGTYTSNLFSINGCDSVITTLLTVNPTYFIPAHMEICQGDSALLPNGTHTNQSINQFFTLNSSLGCDSIIQVNLLVRPTYNQNFPINLCDNESYSIPGYGNVNSTGTYTVQTQTVHGCDSQAVYTVVVNPAYIINTMHTICAGEQIFLDGNFRSEPGIYTDFFKSSRGCDSIVQTSLMVRQLPSGFMPADTSICDYAFFTNVPGFQSYLWESGENSSQIEVRTPGTYILWVADDLGCLGSDSLIVTNGCPPTLYVPNAFTVNSDGLNEQFRAYGTRIQQFEMRIFNRWGELIFFSDNIENGWNGWHNGVPQPMGVYSYRIDYRFETGFEENEPILGRVQLIR
jgi:gliding motility-associated-like protein